MPKTPWWRILVTTWTGRLILINTVVFVLLSYQSGSLWEPTQEALMRWGAKDPVLIARGEYWRFITPMFVHIGIIHFAFNSWALYIIGQQLESLLKAKWFLFVYFVAGISGAVASSLWSLAMSAGASGAIFGLLGAGFYIERLVGRLYHQQTGMVARGGAYTGMIVANLILGFIVPQIDNAAHLGGLIGGFLATAIVLWARPNRLAPQRPARAAALALGLGLALLGGAVLAASPAFLMQRVDAALAQQEKDVPRAYQAAEVGVGLDPHHVPSRLFRARIDVMMGKSDEAVAELQMAAGQPTFLAALHRWRGLLAEEGYGPQADRIYQIFAATL